MTSEDTNKQEDLRTKKMGRRAFLICGIVAAGGAVAVGVEEAIKSYNAEQENKAIDDSFGEAQQKTAHSTPNTVDGSSTGAVNGASAPTADPQVVDSGLPVNYEADDNALPTSGMGGVSLDGITDGAGYGGGNVSDWNRIPLCTLRIPEVALSIPWVPKGSVLRTTTTNADGTKDSVYDVQVPVSFQAGWLNVSSPITAEKGTSYFFGHTNWANGADAPMSAIKLAQPGMIVQTTDAGGKLVEWVITQVGSTAQTELDKNLNVSDTQGEKRLIAATCTRDANGAFTRNAWIIAKPK